MTGSLTRTWRLTSLLALFALLLAACNAPSGVSTAPGTDASAPAAADASAPAATDASAPAAAADASSGAQDVRIVVSDAPGDDATQTDKDNFQSLIARYQQTYPGVTLEGIAGGYSPEAFAAKVAGGTVENAFGVWFTETQKLIGQGVVADVTDLVRASEYYDCMNPDALAVVTGQDGRIYGLPVDMYGLGMVYNRKLFEEAGLDPNTPPTTWEEVRQAAKQIKDNTGKPGFAFLSTGNQGGWHFTTVLFSMGGDAETQQNGEWAATFGNDKGAQVLQLLKDMRWTDNSMTEEQLLDQGKVAELMATGNLGMAIGGIPGGLQETYNADINDFGLAALPQGGGNATLGGGYAWMFRKDQTPEELQAAVDYVLFRSFNPETLENDLKAAQTKGDPIGFPAPALLTGECLAARQAVVDEYANVPTDNYTPYVEGMKNIKVRTEPPIEVQQMYAAIDPAVQAVLTDQSADPQQVISDAATQFQTSVLDAQ